jgi:hypothetical protein
MHDSAHSDHDRSSQFDEALEALSSTLFGHRVTRHQSSILDTDPLQWLRQRANAALTQLRLQSYSTHENANIWFDFINEPTVNACVFRHGSLHCIAVHHITVAGMMQIFSELLTRSDVFPETGDLNNLDFAMPTDLNHIGVAAGPKEATVKGADLGLPISMPNGDRRYQLVTFLQRLSLDLIYFHELNHIMLGHLGHSELRFGPCALFEVPHDKLSSRSANADLEFAADFSAGAALGDCILNHSFATAGRVAASLDEEVRRKETLKLAETVLFAAGVTFVQFEAQLLANGLKGIPDYPLSETRWFSVLRGMERRITKHDAPFASDLINIVLPRTFKSLNTAFSESNCNDPLFGPIFTDENRRRDAIDNMLEFERALWDTINGTKQHALILVT